MIYKDSTSLFDILLEIGSLFSAHDRNIQQLALEMLKVTKGLAPTIVSSLFLQCGVTGTQDHNRIFSSTVNTVYFGQNSIKYLVSLIWNSIPTTLRNIESFVVFRSLI